ncbi:hypothetical protein ACHAXT_003381 [Thalassiosira profunda]
MKLAVVAAALACLAPSPGAIAKEGGKNPIVGRVKVVGSDAGACAGYEGKAKNCGASQTLTARKYADGTARGRFSRVWALDDTVVDGNSKNKIEGDLSNVRMWSASIDCLNFIEGEDGTVQAVVTGKYTRCDLLVPKEVVEEFGGFAGYCEVGGLFVAAAKIDGDGEPFYTQDYNIVIDPVDGPPKRVCTDFELDDKNFGYNKHDKGRLEIEQNQLEDV